MSDEVKVEVQGAAQLEATLKQAADKVQDMSGPNAKAADAILGATRAPRRTGALQGSLQPLATETEAGVQSDLIYAPVIHNGWPAHNIAPQPFIREAFARVQPAIDAIYQKAGQDVLNSVKGA